jgi:hypothetical protein
MDSCLPEQQIKSTFVNKDYTLVKDLKLFLVSQVNRKLLNTALLSI